MATDSLAAWLRREPKPARLRLANGQLMAYPSKATRGSKALKDLASALEAMAPERVEALAEDGTILRVRSFEQEDADDDAPKEGKSISVADVVKVLPELARLMSAAADQGAHRHAQAYELAFGKYESLVTVISDRLQAMETAWVQTVNQSIKERVKFADQLMAAQAAAQEGQGDPLDAMMMQVISQRLGGNASPEAVAAAMAAMQQAANAEQAKAATNGKATNGKATNGKAKPS